MGERDLLHLSLAALNPAMALHHLEKRDIELETDPTARLRRLSAEDSLNIALREVTVTARDGRVSQLDQVYIRGSMVRFFSASPLFPPPSAEAPVLVALPWLLTLHARLSSPPVVPDMLANAPMFKRVGPNAMKGRGIGTARGRATILRGSSLFPRSLHKRAADVSGLLLQPTLVVDVGTREVDPRRRRSADRRSWDAERSDGHEKCTRATLERVGRRSRSFRCE